MGVGVFRIAVSARAWEGGVDVLVAGGGLKGNGAVGSCSRKNENEVTNNSAAAIAIKINWFVVRFLIIVGK